MIVKGLNLINFRTYENINLLFNTRLIFFVGENGEGKTNLLESLSILSSLKSFRGNTDDEVLKWNQSNYYISSIFIDNDQECKFEFGYEKSPIRRKKIKLNGNAFKKQSDAIGFFPCVVLSPVDMNIVEGSDSERRKFIDSLLNYLEPNYNNNLNEYNRLLKHRNFSLKNKKINPELLLVWDNMLCEKDEIIRKARKKWFIELNELFQKNLHLLSGSRDEFTIHYKPNVNSQSDFKIMIRESYHKDLRVGYTTIGCHRDEVLIGYKNKDIMEFGSQGQKRSSVISIKIASFELLKRSIQKNPILLIDDVIRELDVKRRKFFVDLISGCGQAFFTTTDLEGIQDYIGELKDPKQIFLIKSGKVESIAG